MSLPNEVEKRHHLHHPKTHCSLHLNQTVNEITKNEELWKEFRQELQNRQVVNSLAAKEVMSSCLQTRTKDTKDPTNSMSEHLSDSKISSCMNAAEDQGTKMTEHKAFIAHLLHENKLSTGNMSPFPMPLNKNQMRSKALPRFDFKNIELGKKLGNGSQSVVYEFKSFSSLPSKSLFKKQNEEWTHIKDHTTKSDLTHLNSQCKQQLPVNFAVKLPRRDDKKYKENMKELLHESNILSSVDHPNIIKIHGVSSIEESQASANRSSEPFFLVLDRLSYNLNDLLKIWASKKKNIDDFNFQTFKEESFQQRLKVVYNIATAVKHLHKENIIHRDIKPANIGFDSQGKLKLFDFGYATKLLPKDHLSNGKYKLKGGIGTCRYMAPEIARNEPYNELADVYSFGILMWETLALKTPYKNLSYEGWFQRVVFEGKRPKIDKSWPTELQSLLSCCWSEDMNERPSFDTIIDALDKILM